MDTPRTTIAQLERENERLQGLVRMYQRMFTHLEEGDYIATDDGDICGPYDDVLSEAEASASDGIGCTILHVGARVEAEDVHSDAYNGVTAGIDYPASLRGHEVWS